MLHQNIEVINFDYLKDEINLSIFERQILRKIFGPVNIDSVWRIRNNMEIDNLIEEANIVRFIKA